MQQIHVQKLYKNGDTAEVEQLDARRGWMDETPERHAYMCFPLNLTNRLGWGISFPKDIRFIWDGITDTTPDHIKIIEGEQFVGTNRGNATLSFYTGLRITTDKNTSLLTMPVPNLFTRGAQCYTTLISTSFYFHSLPVAWRVTEPNVEICIPAGTPVAAILPVSLGNLQENYELSISEGPASEEYFDEVRKYGEIVEIKSETGEWLNSYRDAVNYEGKSIGSHETKSIRLKTVKCPYTGQTYEVGK